MAGREFEFNVESSKFKSADQAILPAKHYPRTGVRCAAPPSRPRVSTFNFELSTAAPTQPTAHCSQSPRHTENESISY